MSGLRDDIQMEVSRGQITLRSARTPRADWRKKIAQVAASNPAAALSDKELDDWEETSSDGLDEVR